MENVTLIPDSKQVKNFLSKYGAYQEASKNPYIKAFLKVPGATISFYTSGKVLLQGEDVFSYAQELGHTGSAPQTSSGGTPSSMRGPGVRSFKQDMPLIGSDEVGNGSYFGCLSVVASYVEPQHHAWLREIGVGDSKTLTDQKIRQLAPLLMESIPHQALVLNPSKYNEVIASGYNAVSIKVALHNQAIYLLLQKGVEPQKIVIDAFTSQRNYEKYLKAEKNHFQNPISLEEKAEGKYLAVAVSSVIARHLFLENLENLGKEMGLTLPSGAGANADKIAVRILRQYGMDGLNYTAKLHFKNTQKAQNMLK